MICSRSLVAARSTVACVMTVLALGCARTAPPCAFNSDCPLAHFCRAGACVSECTDDQSCVLARGEGAVCSSLGQCLGGDADGGARDAALGTDASLRDVGTDASAIDASYDAGADAADAEADASDDGGADSGDDGGADAGGDGGADAGSDAGDDAFVPLPGALNETGLPAEADYCVIQYPPSLDVAAGVASVAIYGQMYEAGRTDATAGGPAPGVLVQLGYGPAGSDPRTSHAWSFAAVTFNVEVGNNDEYAGSLTIGTAGAYAYAYRFSFDGGANFTYCDTNGAGSNAGLTFEVANLGRATVM